jgi:TonB family protein
MPTDPKALMLLASKSNNLTGEDMKPWHIRATFQLLDDQGHQTDEGTFEEFWVAPTKSKTTYSTSKFTRTDYRTSQGLLRSGGEPPSTLTVSAATEFVEPLPSREFIEHETFESKPGNAGTMKLSCLTKTQTPVNPGLYHCLQDDIPALRVNVLGYQSLQVLHNRIQKFQDHYLAGDLRFMRDGKPVLTAHLEKIELLDPVNETDFTPSPDAKLVPLDKPVPLRVNISGGIAQAMILKRVPPDYPPIAKAAKVSGTVVLQAIIDKEGHIANLHVISGPAMLQQASLDAVQQWSFRPYLLNGQPVEVQTTIYVVFSLPAQPMAPPLLRLPSNSNPAQQIPGQPPFGHPML